MEEDLEKKPIAAKTIAIIAVLSVLMTVNLTILGINALDKSADIFSIEDVVSVINDKNFKDITDVDGGENFVNDMSQIKHVFDIKTQVSPDGLLASFSGTTSNGNSLHPFYAYFKTQNGKLKGISWNKDVTGELVSKNIAAVNIKNTGDFAWSSNDIWENYSSGNPVKLITTNKNGLVKPGDAGTFALDSKERGDFTPHNLTHGYIILIKN